MLDYIQGPRHHMPSYLPLLISVASLGYPVSIFLWGETVLLDGPPQCCAKSLLHAIMAQKLANNSEVYALPNANGETGSELLARLANYMELILSDNMTCSIAASGDEG
jgi:hypothetical protein